VLPDVYCKGGGLTAKAISIESQDYYKMDKENRAFRTIHKPPALMNEETVKNMA
jgi:hypothetical protein